MSIKIYESGSFRPLSGQKIYSSGAWVTIPGTAKIYLNGSWYYVDQPVSSGVVINSSGGVFADPQVESSWLWKGTIINSGGTMLVLSGGTAASTAVKSYGHMNVKSGGTAISTTVDSQGAVQVFGTARSANVIGHMFVFSGGTAVSITVNSRAWLMVSGGGTALNVTSETGAIIQVGSGGSIT